MMKISVIGLGKLGLCTAACIASKGHSVVGADNSEPVISALKKRICPTRENGLEDLLKKSFERMTFTMDVREAVLGTDVSLIVVPTPSGPNGAFSNDYVLAVLKAVAPALAQKKDFHVVDVVSTVMPGSSQREFIPLLEEAAHKKCGVDFGFIYNPEFIALGSVIRDFLNPDLVLIGASDEKSGETVRNLYESFVESAPEFAVMTLVNAEITKLALNCYVTMKITYANELARLCEAVKGADVDVVTGALGADTRVGRRCLKGGLGFAGPCFPRDNAAFQKVAADAGVELLLPPQVVRSNDSIVDYLFGVVAGRVGKGATIALLGFAYKPGTHITECSQSLKLMNRFLEADYRIAAHDPMAEVEIPHQHKDSVTVYDTPEEAVTAVEAVLLLTPWPEYGAIDWESLWKGLPHPIHFFDCWRVAKNAACAGDKVRYWALG